MNTEELKQKALAATPGPWIAEVSWQSTFLEGKHDGKWAIRKSNTSFGFAPLAYVKGDKRITGGDGALNAQFIAAANPAAVLELIAEVERVTKQRDELLAALKSYRVARAMPSYGDYASIQWESQQGPTNPQWGGGDCNKHGRWYGHCHCCANDWDKLKKQADQDAVHARDNALRKADSLAVEAISKAEG